LTPARCLDELAPATMVVEAIIEDIAAKQELFRALEGVIGGDAVLATNTSSLSVTAMASACGDPRRVVGLHFFNPVPLMKVAEVIPGLRTLPAVVERARDLVREMGHRAVQAADSPGFLVNHVNRGLLTEGLRIVQEGIATVGEVDAVVRDAMGFRMGPFQLFDLTGMDVSIHVMESLYAQFYHEPRYRPAQIARRQVDGGMLGRKTGHGWYAYGDDATTAEAVPPVTAPRPVWIDAADVASAEWLGGLIDDASWPRDAHPAPHGDSLCLIAPIGADCTTAALRLGLDPARVVAVDRLSGHARRRLTAMINPASDPSYREAACCLLSKTAPVSLINDSPGFIAQRIVAMIVNVGCDIAQQRIAAPLDIDLAARLALGYPMGPLELGDSWGAKTILRILAEMAEYYGDPRYRPSPWLKRRAMLELSLTTPER
jgi:3-hydroxybutyryl-CoA dehydrogenase